MSNSLDLWYFAYGANMAAVVLARRAVQPRLSLAATLTDYALRFNHPGMPPLEPVFANIEPAPGATVYGVAHCITAGEAVIFDHFEPGYHRITVGLRLADGSTPSAFAYTSAAPVALGVPSARYLSLLLAGAYEYGLPAALIAEWEALRIRASTAGPTAPSRADLQAVQSRAPDAHLPSDLVQEWQQRAKRE